MAMPFLLSSEAFATSTSFFPHTPTSNPSTRPINSTFRTENDQFSSTALLTSHRLAWIRIQATKSSKTFETSGQRSTRSQRQTVTTQVRRHHGCFSARHSEARPGPSPCLPSAPAPPVTRPRTAHSQPRGFELALCCRDALSSDVHGAHALIFRSCLESPPRDNASRLPVPTAPYDHSLSPLLSFRLLLSIYHTMYLIDLAYV